MKIASSTGFLAVFLWWATDACSTEYLLMPHLLLLAGCRIDIVTKEETPNG